MLEHLFPLQDPPTCLACREPCTRDSVGKWNTKGNVGRPYWTCVRHKPWKFSCFDDTIGITIENPQCPCRITSRRTAGKYGDFFSCARGVCGWTRSAASRGVSSPPQTPKRPTVAANRDGLDSDEVDHGYQDLPTPPVTPSRSQVAVNRNLAGGHMKMDSGYQTPCSLPVTPEVVATSATVANKSLAGRDIGVHHGNQTPYSTPSPPEARNGSAVATTSTPPVSPSPPHVVANNNRATRDLGMDYDSQRPPTTTVPPPATSRSALAFVTNGNRSTRDFQVDRGDQTQQSTSLSPQATSHPAPAVTANGNLYGRDDTNYGYQTPHNMSMSPGARTAAVTATNYPTSNDARADYDNQTPYRVYELSVEPSCPPAAAAVNGNRLGRDGRRDYAHQEPHNIPRPIQTASRPAPTAATNRNIPEARRNRVDSPNELPGEDGGQAYGYQISYGMYVQPPVPSRLTWAANGNLDDRRAGMGFGYGEHRRRGGCRGEYCALLQWLCGCCGLLGCLTYSCCGCELCK
jgi:hypothetical protein